VALLSRRAASRHLSDDQFAHLWSAAAANGQPVSDAHLSGCAQCRSRYANFTAWLDRLHDDAVAEADEVFPPERLAAQQAQVMRRLEALERPARVIAFPRFARPVTSTQGHVQRWVAAAAAAGLVIGLAAGQFFDIRHALSPIATPEPAQSARLTAPPPLSRANVVPVSTSSVSDETLFFGVDPAEMTERLSMLRSIDDITPRARDFERSR
jgi:anti-sigma factor RsiW